jgi:hypothetical protein
VNGWPPGEAHTLYKNMLKRLRAQKEMPALRNFEKDLMGRFNNVWLAGPGGVGLILEQ